MEELLSCIKDLFCEIHRYFKKNKYIIIFFFITVLTGATNIFGLSKQPVHKSWVLSAFVFTFGYTIVFHLAGVKKKYFERLGGIKSWAVILANFFLMIIIIIIANDFLKLLNFYPSRFISLLLMFIFAFIFSILNWILHKHFQQESNSKMGDSNPRKKTYSDLSNSFRSMVFMSDLPTTITFLVLAIYCLFINSYIQMDYFFSGAVAFQMTASNAIWIFNDDKFFAKV